MLAPFSVRFLDLQDKLHLNICRRRNLVAIGTHNLDSVKPPFYYRALPAEQIVFQPLNQTRDFNAREVGSNPRGSR